MRRITVMGAGLALVAGVVAAGAQGIGYAPGVNPSNSQDLTHRSNSQDLLAPGGSNPQDLVRRSPSVNVPLGPAVTSVPAARSLSPALRYTVKTKLKSKPKFKPKPKPHHQASAARR